MSLGGWLAKLAAIRKRLPCFAASDTASAIFTNMSAIRSIPRVARPALRCQARRGFAQTARRAETLKPETPAGAGGASGALAGGLAGGAAAFILGVSPRSGGEA